MGFCPLSAEPLFSSPERCVLVGLKSEALRQSPCTAGLRQWRSGVEEVAPPGMQGGLPPLHAASGIRQADVPGLSERQLRRLETAESQPTLEAMQALAERHGLELDADLDRLAAACASSPWTEPR